MSVLANLGTPRRVLGKKKGLRQKCPVAEKSLISTPDAYTSNASHAWKTLSKMSRNEHGAKQWISIGDQVHYCCKANEEKSCFIPNYK